MTIDTQATRNESNVRLEATLPIGAASLASILRTEELRARPSRPPDHERENSALVALVGTLADHPDTILQTLANKVRDVLRADSAGLSLLTKDGERFYWAAIAGAWQPHIGGGTPRDFGPWLTQTSVTGQRLSFCCVDRCFGRPCRCDRHLTPDARRGQLEAVHAGLRANYLHRVT